MKILKLKNKVFKITQWTDLTEERMLTNMQNEAQSHPSPPFPLHITPSTRNLRQRGLQ